MQLIVATYIDITLYMALVKIYYEESLVNPITLTTAVIILKDVYEDCTMSGEDLDNVETAVHNLRDTTGVEPDIINLH